MANKGVLLVSVAVPHSRVPVEILTTHFNSRRSSGVTYERSLYAYQRQADFLRHFLAINHDPASPIILAGDFNMGTRPGRRDALFENLRNWGRSQGNAPIRDALLSGLAQSPAQAGPASEGNWIVRRASDRQFAADGRQVSLSAARLSVPFGRGNDGEMLSDHMGFSIEYRLGK